MPEHWRGGCSRQWAQLGKAKRHSSCCISQHQAGGLWWEHMFKKREQHFSQWTLHFQAWEQWRGTSEALNDPRGVGSVWKVRGYIWGRGGGCRAENCRALGLFNSPSMVQGIRRLLKTLSPPVSRSLSSKELSCPVASHTASHTPRQCVSRSVVFCKSQWQCRACMSSSGAYLSW